MKTTNLFIELLVIGVGAMISIGLLGYNLFGDNMLTSLSLNSPIFILPITAVTYVLGIVFDRIFDILTDKWDKSIRDKSEIADQYNKIRTVYYNDSKVIQDVFDYTKNRIRIVRSWMFYFPLLSIIVLFSSGITFSSRMLISGGLITLSIFTAITFRKLSYSFYGLLMTAYSNHKST